MKKYILVLPIVFLAFWAFFKAGMSNDGFWIFITGVATALLWWVAFQEFDGVGKTTKASFVRDFNKEFFTAETRDLVMLLDYKALDFVNTCDIKYFRDEELISSEEFPYFLVNEKIIEQFKIDQKKKDELICKKVYSAYEIDDFLGHFEDIGSFGKRGLLDIGDIYDHFSWYMGIVWKNCEIQKYIETQGGDIYENFEYIYKKCESYGDAKEAGKRSIAWWKIKNFFNNL